MAGHHPDEGSLDDLPVEVQLNILKRVTTLQRKDICNLHATVDDVEASYQDVVGLWRDAPKKFKSQVTKERCHDVCVFCSTWSRRPKHFEAIVVNTNTHGRKFILVFACSTCVITKSLHLKKGCAIVLDDTPCFVMSSVR